MLTSWFTRLRPARPAQTSRKTRRLHRRPHFEALESRQLLTIFTVTNTLDAGPGSLRQAILSANAATTSTTNTINFDVGAGGVQTISPLSPLPAITHTVLIDGTTQPGTQTGPRVVLEGGSAGPSATGLILKASNSTVQELAIGDFAVAGIVVDGGSHDVISGDLIGVLPGGLLPRPNNNGVVLQNGANTNTIGGTTAAARDVISSNLQSGVVITGVGTRFNVIEGDYLGTDPTGLVELSNRLDGVDILSGASSNLVGGTVAAARNVISGNAALGLYIADSGTTNNLVAGNFIGVDATGGRVLRNGLDGVGIVYAASSNTIGGMTAGDGNVISGNGGNGVFITDPGTMNNLVAGNDVGTDPTGSKALPNGYYGVDIIDNASHNTVGGTTPGARNVISGNGDSGIAITDTGTTNNLVAGNFIGTSATGMSALPNGADGVDIHFGASYNTIGGTTAAARNLISGNGNFGLFIADTGTTNNLVAGNDVGVDITGGKALHNASDGVDIVYGASNNTIGGMTAGAGNVISGNGGDGLFIANPGTMNNLIAGDDIGTDLTGGIALPNGSNGVHIVYGASQNTVGGTTPGARNVISGNAQSGVRISDPGTANNVVAGDFIGTGLSGVVALGNHYDGVVITNGASTNLVGGTTAGTRDVISANGIDGVQIDDSGTSNNMVFGDYIGTDTTGSKALGNARAGVYIWNGASGNAIGGATSATRDVISANSKNGVIIDGSSGNAVAGDSIGTDATGSKPLGNGGFGVLLVDGASGNNIGGAFSDAGNLIADNAQGGIWIDGAGNTANLVQFDIIEGNTGNGIWILDAPGNLVVQCTIESNTGYGILTLSSSTNLQGNIVLRDVNGAIEQL
jgi:hypothetical protein